MKDKKYNRLFLLELIALRIATEMTEAVARKMSSVLFRGFIFRKGIFWAIGEHLYFVYYPIISYQWIKVFRVERIDIGKISMNH